MIVIVDINEQATNPEMVDQLRIVAPNLSLGNVSAGDVNIILEGGDILAIERKNAGDFLASIGDGRVFRQVEDMAEAAKFYAIILVGHLSFDKDDMAVVGNRVTGWKGVSVRGAIHAIEFSGCPIVFCSKEKYAQTVMEIVNFVSRPEKHWQMLGHRRVVTFPPVDLRTEIIGAFPGVGIKRAEALLEFCGKDGRRGTLAECFAWASAFSFLKESDRPLGWGNKTVANFREALGLSKHEYLDLKIEGEK